MRSFGALLIVGGCSVLCLVSGHLFADEQPILTAANGQRWVRRIKRVLPDGWSVAHEGDQLLVRRKEAVELRNLINASAVPSADDTRRSGNPSSSAYTFQIRLKFTPKISDDEYDRLAAENSVMQAKVEELRKSIDDIAHKFHQYAPATGEQRRRIADYNAAVSKLSWHDLPDCYTPEHSVFYDSGWPELLTFSSPEVRDECLQVESILLRLFGVYEADVAKGNALPHWSDDPRAKAIGRGAVESVIDSESR